MGSDWKTEERAIEVLQILEAERERGRNERYVNVNDCVWVKLTEKGRRRYERLYPALVQYLHTTPSGWTRFQLWHLMEVYGERMGNGAPLMFETRIAIGDEAPG